MKFTLTYDGELRSNGSPKQKEEIRNFLSPQLEELWNADPVLLNVVRRRFVPRDAGYFVFDTHHSSDGENQAWQRPDGPHVDLLEPLVRHDREYLPLIRNSLALRCGLKIMFLRKEEPGNVYQGGDLDNRLKTLFDALSVPNNDQAMKGEVEQGTTYCLLEDDSLIAGVAVETGRLLSRPNSSKHEVRLVIEVDVRVVQARIYNQIFLGG